MLFRSPLTDQATTPQQNMSFGVPATEPISTNPTETTSPVDNTIPQTAQSDTTAQVSQDQATADLQALISSEVNNIPAQQQNPIQQPSTNAGITNNDEDLPQVPPMM